MRHFPLYAKILLWFFLNLLLLGVAFYLLFGARYRVGPDWLLSGGANERIEHLTDLITAELNDHPQTEWNNILKRFHTAYQLEFFLFHANGSQIAGDTVPLPTEVKARLFEPRGPMRRMPPPNEGSLMPSLHEEPGREPLPDERHNAGHGPRSDDLPFQARSELGPPGPPPMGGLHPKFMVRTTKPTRYWLLVLALVNDPARLRPMPTTLVVLSTSMSGGGLFFDVKPWLAAGLGAVVLSALFWFPLVRGITRSVAQVTHAARQIAAGRFDTRVDARRRDELGELGQSINQMAGQLEGLVTGQKRFLGDIAHELCSPLAKLRMALGILEQRAVPEQKAYVDSANEKAAQMAGLVNELLSFSKASLGAANSNLQPVSLRAAAENAVRRETTEGASIQLDIPADLDALADPELLVRALANLLRNALRYAGGAGPIEITARPQEGEVVLIVADHGPGVPESELPKLFDPFYRVDTSRDRATGGVGLGLSIVRTCVESCRGTVTCRNRQPSGLEITIRLPARGSS